MTNQKQREAKEMTRSSRRREQQDSVTATLMKQQGLWFEPQAPVNQPFTADRQMKGVTVENLSEHWTEFK